MKLKKELVFFIIFNILIVFIIPLEEIKVYINLLSISLLSGYFFNINKEYSVISSLIVTIYCFTYPYLEILDISYLIVFIIISLIELKSKKTIFIIVNLVITIICQSIYVTVAPPILMIFILSSIGLFIGNLAKNKFKEIKFIKANSIKELALKVVIINLVLYTTFSFFISILNTYIDYNYQGGCTGLMTPWFKDKVFTITNYIKTVISTLIAFVLAHNNEETLSKISKRTIINLVYLVVLTGVVIVNINLLTFTLLPIFQIIDSIVKILGFFGVYLGYFLYHIVSINFVIDTIISFVVMLCYYLIKNPKICIKKGLFQNKSNYSEPQEKSNEKSLWKK